MPQTVYFPTGDALFSDSYAVTIHIPKSQQNWVYSVFLGALELMTYTNAWWENGETTTDEAAQIFKQIFWSIELAQANIGDIKWNAAASLPAGSNWLACDGSVVAQSTYTDLFTAIGTTYNMGGEGAGNFRLPNLVGRTIAGVDASMTRIQQSWATALGGSGGESDHTLITAESPSHTHIDAGHVHSGIPTFAPTAAGLEVTFASVEIPLITVPTGTGFAALGNTGGDGSHNTMQPTIVLYPYILAIL